MIVHAVLPAIAALTMIGLARTAHAEPAFTISSPDLSSHATIRDAQMYDHGGCHGKNISPAVSWTNPPPGTVAYAVTLFDPDAPGRGWWHWAVANIPASIHRLPANASASGALASMGAVEARNDFDDDGYSGPCPSAGTVHRYVLTVYALKTMISRVGSGRPAPFFDHEIDSASLAKAEIIAHGRRP